TAVMLPFHYTADISKQDAAEQAQRMGVNYLTLPIESAYDAFMGIMEEPFEGTKPGLAEQNIQARCRGLLLMAMSNKLGGLLLSTSNKSEVAVGYSTLYGDMAGAYTVPKDVYKTDVYRLSRYRNELTPDNPPIPERVITRAPSAELAPDQQDSDSLPEYDVLDGILHLHIEANYHADAIVAQGFKREDVERVLSLVKRNEYKRFQAAPGPRITRRGFGKDWRIPLTNGLEI
ncbi:MAG: NAD(+) synthase, partial [Pseudomonadota bacterium]|nr:NAD(+) synthase [Pseudomonadota bacterium]